MTHDEFVTQLVIHVAEMIEQYEANTGVALQFDADVDIELGRHLTVKLFGEENE